MAGSGLRSSSVDGSGPKLKFITCFGAGLLQVLAFLGRHLLRSKVESELVDLAGELERNVVAIFQHRDAVRVS